MSDIEIDYNYVIEQDAKRFKVLKLIYFETKGDKDIATDTNSICNNTGVCSKELLHILEYLENQSLIKPLGSLYAMYGGSAYITITHQGVCEVEAAIKKPHEPTNYFPAMIQNLSLNIKNVAINKSMSNIQNNDFQGANIGGGVAGRDYTGDVTHNYAIQQNLAKSAAEIQQILKQLEQSYPTTSLVEKATVVEKAINQIENDPTLKARVLGALKLAGKEAFKEAVDHPLVNVLIAGIEGWQEGV
ncbi:hypothetical protein ANSO36C_68090 (plasmid) [Nostoc cf. commune SO-36]|uniref:Uncharacterized protein n=1 Tax=Nostoc cf. commune SO-36 TaxID=449208 RepID=A0ABN6QHV5_NOSCO|nr:hypothetical protein [Nostoc commune]BDI21007.1 hypothetical protein ANSO36C_68090 [Nostoc cf. commune SO-36]